jgi:phospholipase/carboxylesterase
MRRRDFVKTLALAAPAIAIGCDGPSEPDRGRLRLTARPSEPSIPTEPGMHELGLEPERDGFFYLPASYDPVVSWPLVVLLHGAGGSAEDWRMSGTLEEVADAREFIALAVTSRSGTWDMIINGRYGPDVAFLDSALDSLFQRAHVNASQMALGGFSDGATYALSLGASNGDLFTSLMGFSPGFWLPGELHGRPPVFISHGTEDTVLPVEGTRTQIVPGMRSAGYEVRYEEFNGGHTLTSEMFGRAMDWLLGPFEAEE